MAGAAYISYDNAEGDAATEIMRELARQGLPCTMSSPDRTQSILDARCLIALVTEKTAADDAVGRDLGFAMANARPIVPVVLGRGAGERLATFTALQARIDAPDGLTNATLGRIAEAARAFAGSGRIVAMLNIKGGVGKTVLAANVFAAAHIEGGKSVCFIDLDPQHNLSQFFLPPEERNRVRAEAHTVYSILVARGPLSAPREEFGTLPVWLNRTRGAGKQRFDLVVGDERLFEFTMDGRSDADRAEALSRFHDLISRLRLRYDLVVIDANPCATFLTRCAVSAADHIVAPVRPEKYSLTGLNMLEQVVRDIRGRAPRASEFSVLLNGVADRPRTRGGVDVDAATREEIASAPFFGAALLGVAIPFSTVLRYTPVEKYAPNPINLTAMRMITQRALKEQLTGAAMQIVRRASA